MASQAYSTITPRLGKFKGEIIAHAVPQEVIGMFGEHKKMPQNQSDTVVYRRFLPVGATSSSPNKFFADGTGDRTAALVASHLTTEGVTPNAESISAMDLTVVMREYAVLFGFNNKTVDMYEDDIPAEMKINIGERVGLVREMIKFGELKSCTNKFYGGTGTSRATVNGKVSLNMLRLISRSLQANHAKRITKKLAASALFGTTPVESAYVIMAHTDLEADFRDLKGFRHVAEYGEARSPIHENEIGTVENFRIITSPELVCIQDGGAAVGATGCLSTSGSNIDVYQFVATGESAWGDVALRGKEAVDPTYIPVGQKDKTDPLGQRGYVGAKWYQAATVLNNGWMAIGEVGVSSLA